MGRLRYFGLTNVAFIGMLFCTGVAEQSTGQNAITPLADIKTHNKFIIQVSDNGCKCIKYDCGCCQRLEWDVVSMDGKLCINATYLENDYGISLTVTYNNLAIFNETISARNPPPVCFGEDIIHALDAEICLRIYDIDFKVFKDKFHACFEILGKIMKLPIITVKLGCVQTKLRKEIEYIKYNLSSFFKKIEDTLPNVIVV